MKSILHPESYKEDSNMLKKIIIVTVIGLLCALSALNAGGTKEQTTQAQTVYTFGGSTTVAPIANAAIAAFTASRSDVKISYEGLGSSTGLKQLSQGTITLAGSSRELKDSELQSLLKPIVIALDGLSVAVNSSVAIANLSREQLAGIFSGEITNWKEVGGKDASIEVIVRDETSGTYASFKEIVLDPYKKSYKTQSIVARENGELAAKIASTPNAIGYIGMAFNHIVSEAGGHVLTIDGVEPTSQNVIDGSYPISRSLYIVSKGELSESVELDFVNFLLSAKGQSIVAENEFIPVMR